MLLVLYLMGGAGLVFAVWLTALIVGSIIAAVVGAIVLVFDGQPRPPRAGRPSGSWRAPSESPQLEALRRDFDEWYATWGRKRGRSSP